MNTDMLYFQGNVSNKNSSSNFRAARSLENSSIAVNGEANNSSQLQRKSPGYGKITKENVKSDYESYGILSNNDYYIFQARAYANAFLFVVYSNVLKAYIFV